MSLPVVAIVGRPNVGKSTLFNRLIGFRKALVHDRPGVTRDRLYETAEILDRRVLCIDTGGLEPAPDTDLLVAMRAQAIVALEEADVIVFVVDGRLGYTPADQEVADLLRRSRKPVVLAVNKIDGQKHEELSAEFWQVGIDPMITISAEHGRGMYELADAVTERLPESSEDEVDTIDDDDGLLPEDGSAAPIPDVIRIAVVGRPNIGKSTLINHMVGEERHVVHDSPGTTMDPIDSPLEVDGQQYVLVDTAGVRRKSKIDDRLERFVSLRSIRSIERCHVTLLMIDATEGVTSQDAKLVDLVLGRGRALVICINKWDLTKDDELIDSRSVEDDLYRKLPHAPWAPHLFISAKTGKGLHRILPLVNEVFVEFNRRVPTSRLNRFVEDAVSAHSVPQRNHRPVRLYYATQTRIRPPTIVFWSNTPDGVVKSYARYLSNRLRDTFGFEGTPIKLHFRARRQIGESSE